MTIRSGERIPDATLSIPTPKGVRKVSTRELFAGKRVVLFAVPGAFTPTCSDDHLPGFLQRAEEILACGVDAIACMAVNDAYVMGAWGRERKVGEKILMLADGNGDFTRALGLELDATRFGMGLRSRRFAAIVNDGEVELLNVEPAGGVGISGADALLKELKRGG